MGIFDNLRTWFWEPMLDAQQRSRIETIENNRNYRRGEQPKTMKVKFNRADDNISLNFIGLAISRSVSLLFGKGVEFDLPGEDNPDQEYVDTMYSLNRKEILFHKVAMAGAEAGTAYLKIMPDYYEREGVKYPRLVNILPEIVEIHTDPEDVEVIVGYTIEYTITGADGKEKRRKQEILRNVAESGEIINWSVSDYEKSEATSLRWTLLDEQVWPYVFPPMIHTQNLPAHDSVYGEPDITDDVLKLQDRINYIASNISKIIRYHAHPRTIGIGFSKSQLEGLDSGPDKLFAINAPGADVKNLEMQSDLSSSQGYLTLLRNTLMDVTRTVDVSSLPDKIGALTNFGLRVLYQDALQKLATKRELYGEMLTELNRRCLQVAGRGDDGGMCVWPDPLPASEAEKVEGLKSDLEMGIASKQTVAKARGYNWDTEQERMAKEAVGEGDIGSLLLENFMTGRNA